MPGRHPVPPAPVQPVSPSRRARTRDDDWNTSHRAEAPLERADRNFAELLQGLRIAQTGGQILFGFLLSLPFTAYFAFGRAVSMLLSAPAAAHRLMFQRGRKRELVRLSHGFAGSGLAVLAVTVTAGFLLVVDVAVGRGAAVLGTSLMASTFAALWLLIPWSGMQEST